MKTSAAHLRFATMVCHGWHFEVWVMLQVLRGSRRGTTRDSHGGVDSGTVLRIAASRGRGTRVGVNLSTVGLPCGLGAFLRA